MYIERKTGFDGDGPARIGRVRFSKTGHTIYYRDLVLRVAKGAWAYSHVEETSGDQYWVTGVKRDPADSDWTGSGPIEIDEDVADEYATIRARRAK